MEIFGFNFGTKQSKIGKLIEKQKEFEREIKEGIEEANESISAIDDSINELVMEKHYVKNELNIANKMLKNFGVTL